MPAVLPTSPFDAFQSQFHRRWGHLTDPHVRVLAWLLDAPDLLDPLAPQWQGRIATLAGINDSGVAEWLVRLNREPAALHAYLDMQPFARLGRYAEKLMAFYLRHQGVLIAHGVQVRAGKNDTVGEFDFLLRSGDALLHWEFATKFYLLESTGAGQDADYFVGPNLADTLGAKMRKIFDRQLSLSRHPAAQMHLPQPVAAAQALVKGWLFYQDDDPQRARTLGVSATHCRGFWCALEELDCVEAERYAILPRLSWLAPARLPVELTVDKQALQTTIAADFRHDTMPRLVALLEPQGDHAIETRRGFIVPDDWRSRAGQRIRPVRTPV